MNSPINQQIVKEVIDSFHLPEFKKATIREIVAIANEIEKRTNQKYIRMEFGVPGIPAVQIGVDAEIDALKNGVASSYPILDGLPFLKEQASRFIKAFIDIDIPKKCCIPTVGSMQGTFISILVAGQCNRNKNTVLFIDPGFPVQKQQVAVMGYKCATIDAYDYRGNDLLKKIEEFLKNGDVCAIVYSNPNNPSWICLQEEELKGIGQLATAYDVIVMEDLAYFGMDFRKEINKPFQAPFQATVAKYTDNYILFISSSKIFSYAGQRIGIAAISEKIFYRRYEDLRKRYGVDEFGNVLVSRVFYAISAGVTHSSQYALASMMKAVCDGELDFLDQVSIYAKRAKKMKEIFVANGFYIVYSNDLGDPIGDGFYFTINYPGFTGAELMEKFIYYGMSAISLDTTGSQQQGLRICTSFIQESQYEDLQLRVEAFAKDFPIL